MPTSSPLAIVVVPAPLNFCKPVHVFALLRSMPQSEIAPAPVYELPRRVVSLVSAPSVPPREMPLIVLAERRFVPIDVVATSLPFWSVDSSALVKPEKYTFVEVASKADVVAFVKFWRADHQLTWPSAREATTEPVVGEIVRVPSALETAETVPPPAHDPNEGTPLASSSKQLVPALFPARLTQSAPL